LTWRSLLNHINNERVFSLVKIEKIVDYGPRGKLIHISRFLYYTENGHFYYILQKPIKKSCCDRCCRLCERNSRNENKRHLLDLLSSKDIGERVISIVKSIFALGGIEEVGIRAYDLFIVLDINNFSDRSWPTVISQIEEILENAFTNK